MRTALFLDPEAPTGWALFVGPEGAGPMPRGIQDLPQEIQGQMKQLPEDIQELLKKLESGS